MSLQKTIIRLKAQNEELAFQRRQWRKHAEKLDAEIKHLERDVYGDAFRDPALPEQVFEYTQVRVRTLKRLKSRNELLENLCEALLGHWPPNEGTIWRFRLGSARNLPNAKVVVSALKALLEEEGS